MVHLRMSIAVVHGEVDVAISLCVLECNFRKFTVSMRVYRNTLSLEASCRNLKIKPLLLVHTSWTTYLLVDLTILLDKIDCSMFNYYTLREPEDDKLGHIPK